MGSILFTPTEKALLKSYISHRLDEYAKDEYSFDQKLTRRYITPLKTVLEKIEQDVPVLYTLYEKGSCVSCINENIEKLHEKADTRKENANWCMLSAEEIELYENIDAAYSILDKCGFYEINKKKLRPWPYAATFDLLRKIKASDTIYLSKVGSDNYYKIGFVYNGFELRHAVSLHDTVFTSLHGEDAFVYRKGHFSDVVSREDAKQIVASLNENLYPAGILPFFRCALS
jgi:hypothetical protein